MESVGYSIQTSTSSGEALELFHSKSNDFDVATSDMTMPSRQEINSHLN